MKTRETLMLLIVVMSIMSVGLGYIKFIKTPREVAVEQPEHPEESVVEPEPEPEPEVDPLTIEDSLSSITSDELKEHVVYLASDELEGRQSGEPGCDKARDYILKQFEEYGLQTELDEFRVSRGDGSAENVYAWIEGTESPDEVIVVGAHYDHVGKSRRGGGVYNGADDNASGTAAVLEMAEALSQIREQCKRTVVFQLYAGEELGMVGSSHYCSDPTFPKSSPSLRSHIFMENLDMIGYLSQLASVNTGPIDPIIRELRGKYPFAQRVTRSGMSGGASDHAPFSRRGVPAVFIHTGTHRHYHQTTDTADRLNYEGMEGISRYGLELVWNICENGLDRQVMKSYENQEIEMLDHGVLPFQK
jgi:hypothetical protein